MIIKKSGRWDGFPEHPLGPCGDSRNTAIWVLTTDPKPLPLIATKSDFPGMALRPVWDRYLSARVLGFLER